MKTLIMQSGDVRTSLAERTDGHGVSFVQHQDYIPITWDEAIKVRDWLQLAIAERTERLAHSAPRE